MSLIQRNVLMGRTAIRRATTYFEFRRLRRSSISELDELFRDVGKLEPGVRVSLGQALGFVQEERSRWRSGDEQTAPTDAQRRLYSAFCGLVLSSGTGTVEVASVINEATWRVEGDWDVCSQRYQQESREPDYAMIIARHALHDGLIRFAATH